MAELRDKVVAWLYADFWNEHTEANRADSVLSRYVLKTHRQCFRVKSKRLYREMMTAHNDMEEALSKRALVEYLARELMDSQRLAGKTEGKTVRLSPMIECESLSVLMEFGRGAVRHWVSCPSNASLAERRDCIGKARQGLVNLLNHIDSSDVGHIPDEKLRCLTDDMLCAEQPAGQAFRGKRTNDVEFVLELIEDLLRGETVLGRVDAPTARDYVRSEEFACWAAKYAHGGLTATGIQEALLSCREGETLPKGTGDFVNLVVVEGAKGMLANLGRPAPLQSGEIPNPSAARKQGLDLRLVELYFQEHEVSIGCGDAVRPDLAKLYGSTCDDPRYQRLFVPAAIDSQTGVGLYLIGSDKFAIHAPDLAKRLKGKTTIIAVDNHLAEPQTLIADVLKREESARSVWANEMRQGLARGMHPVRYDAKLSSLEEWLGQGIYAENARRSQEEVAEAVRELCDEYQEMCGISLRESFIPGQGISEAPEGCPDRFLRFFGHAGRESPQ